MAEQTMGGGELEKARIPIGLTTEGYNHLRDETLRELTGLYGEGDEDAIIAEHERAMRLWADLTEIEVLLGVPLNEVPGSYESDQNPYAGVTATKFLEGEIRESAMRWRSTARMRAEAPEALEVREAFMGACAKRGTYAAVRYHELVPDSLHRPFVLPWM